MYSAQHNRFPGEQLQWKEKGKGEDQVKDGGTRLKII
jgi:hypothetical protein